MLHAGTVSHRPLALAYWPDFISSISIVQHFERAFLLSGSANWPQCDTTRIIGAPCIAHLSFFFFELTTPTIHTNYKSGIHTTNPSTKQNFDGLLAQLLHARD